MERAEMEAALAARGWLAECEAGFRRALLDRARAVTFPPDAFVFHAGDLAGGIYGIARGGFILHVSTAGASSPVAATILRAGAWFGNGPLVSGRRRWLSFRAAEASHALHLPLPTIRELNAVAPGAAQAFAELSGANMQLAIRTVSDLLIPEAERRIAATLLRLTGAEADAVAEDPLGFRLRQAELGEMANASRRSVVRALAGFRARGWVALGHQRIAVLDAGRLARFAYG